MADMKVTTVGALGRGPMLPVEGNRGSSTVSSEKVAALFGADAVAEKDREPGDAKACLMVMPAPTRTGFTPSQIDAVNTAVGILAKAGFTVVGAISEMVIHLSKILDELAARPPATLQLPEVQLMHTNSVYSTGPLLSYVVSNGHDAALDDAIVGANVHERDKLGWSPIMYAGRSGNAVSVAKLAKAGGNLEEALVGAATTGQTELVGELISWIDPSALNGDTGVASLSAAMRNVYPAVVTLLYPRIDHIQDGYKLLDFCLSTGMEDISGDLLRKLDIKGIVVQAGTNNNGRMLQAALPLMDQGELTGVFGKNLVVQALLNHNWGTVKAVVPFIAQEQLTGELGKTVVMQAIENDDGETVKAVLPHLDESDVRGEWGYDAKKAAELAIWQKVGTVPDSGIIQALNEVEAGVDYASSGILAGIGKWISSWF